MAGRINRFWREALLFWFSGLVDPPSPELHSLADRLPGMGGRLSSKLFTLSDEIALRSSRSWTAWSSTGGFLNLTTVMKGDLAHESPYPE